MVKAERHNGVIIEVRPEAFGEEARVALVRDPSGAGFTLYEGPEINPQITGLGTVQRRYHHLPDIDLIAPFYRDLFGWSFERRANTPWQVYDILDLKGALVAQAEEVPEAIRGKFRYWMPCFIVSSAENFSASLAGRGGAVLSELPEGRVLVADRQGAHFMICEAGLE